MSGATSATASSGVPSKGLRGIGIGFWLSVGWLVLVVLVAVLAPWLPIKDPNLNYIAVGERPPYGPSATHLFGTDQDARDMFARTVFGARTSLVIGFVAISFGMVIGGTLGIIAGYYRGWTDRLLSSVMLVLLSFPSLILAILITSLLDRGLTTISITLGVLAIAPVARLARAATLAYADRDFVTATRALGAGDRRIIIRELLPNVVIPMSALALLGMAVAIVAEGGLAFLGLSVEKGTTWGKLILFGAGARDLERAPWIAFAPIIVLFLTVLALNYAGDRIRDHFDAREIAL